MLRLVKPEAKWVSLSCRVDLHVAPVTSLIMAAAAAAPSVRDLPEEASPDERFAALVTEVARRVILDWRGVVGGKGDAPLPVTPENVGILMDLTLVHREFAQMVVHPHLLLADEKKGLPGLPSGSLPRTGPDTAQAVPGDAQPARPN